MPMAAPPPVSSPLASRAGAYSCIWPVPVSAARVAVALSRESKRVVNDMQPMQGTERQTDRQTDGRTRPSLPPSLYRFTVASAYRRPDRR